MSKSIVIAEMLDQSRKFNKFYLSKLDPLRMHERVELNGIVMNSPYWIIGHLAWAEAGTIQDSCKGPSLLKDWMEPFAIGQGPESVLEGPELPRILADMDEIHSLSLEYIRSLSDEQLELPAYVAPARWETVVRKAIYHGIRHESFHTGQLSWIAKVQGAQLP